MKINNLILTISRYSCGKEMDDNIKYLLSELFNKLKIVNFKSSERQDKFSHMILSTEEDEEFILNVVPGHVCLIHKSEHIVDEYVVTKDGNMYITTFEQRPRGIIVSEAKKGYITDPENKDRKINNSLSVNRYCFNCNTISGFIPGYYDSQYSYTKLREFKKYYHQQIKFIADSVADYVTYYSSYIPDNSLDIYEEEKSSVDTSKVYVYINGEEKSFYNPIKGSDKLDIVYQLFMGKINNDTIDEILSITTGELSKDTFDLYSKLGYTDKENQIVFASMIKDKEKRRILLENYNCGILSKMVTREDLINIFTTKTLTVKGLTRTLK